MKDAVYALWALLFLSACGGGGGSSDPESQPTPAPTPVADRMVPEGSFNGGYGESEYTPWFYIRDGRVMVEFLSSRDDDAYGFYSGEAYGEYAISGDSIRATFMFTTGVIRDEGIVGFEGVIPESTRWQEGPENTERGDFIAAVGFLGEDGMVVEGSQISDRSIRGSDVNNVGETSVELMSGVWADGGVSLTLDQDGSLFGQRDDGCALSGDVLVPDNERTLFEVSFEMAGCPQAEWDGSYMGLGLYRLSDDPNGDPIQWWFSLAVNESGHFIRWGIVRPRT